MRSLNNKDNDLHCTTNTDSVNISVCTIDGTDVACLLVQTCGSIFGFGGRCYLPSPKTLLMLYCTVQCIVLVLKLTLYTKILHTYSVGNWYLSDQMKS